MQGAQITAPDLRSAFRRASFRLTRQRLKVIDAVFDVRATFTTREILHIVRQSYPEVPLSTVSETISVMKELNLLTELSAGDGETVYRPVIMPRKDSLVCRTCSLTVKVGRNDFDAIAERLKSEYGFRLQSNLVILGECPSCWEKRTSSDNQVRISV